MTLPLIKFFNYKDSRGYDIFVKTKINSDNFYNSLIENSFEESINGIENLPRWIINMDGMSGKKYRFFINNLIKKIKQPNYLEIGCWKGSTCCSAMYNNFVSVCCIDDWSEFNGPKKEFIENSQKCVNESNNIIRFQFIENNFKNINYDKIGTYDVYFFDGPHEEQDHYDSLILTKNCLSDKFIFICDDWNWESVRKGTKKALKDINVNIDFTLSIKTSFNGKNPVIDNYSENSDWHNGYFVTACSKK